MAWELEFPLIVVKKALKTLELEREWKRIIQVVPEERKRGLCYSAAGYVYLLAGGFRSQVIKWMLSKGQGKTMGTYYTLLNALAEDGRLEEAEELWAKIFSENLECLPRVFFVKMISIYYANAMHQQMFEV